MNKRIGIAVLFFFTLTACAGTERTIDAEKAAWVALTPFVIIASPVILASVLYSNRTSQDRVTVDYQAVTDPIYDERIAKIRTWSPVEDANQAWQNGDNVYWRVSIPKNRFTGLNSKPGAEPGVLLELERDVIVANAILRANKPFLLNRAGALENNLPIVDYASEADSVTFACYEQVAAEYKYLFNVQMAQLSNEYLPLPDYQEEIKTKLENPCELYELQRQERAQQSNDGPKGSKGLGPKGSE